MLRWLKNKMIVKDWDDSNYKEVNLIKQPIEWFEINAQCIKCNGVLEYKDRLFGRFENQYRHKCNKCGGMIGLSHQYPHVDYLYKD